MIRNHHIDRAVSERLPKLFAVGALANRRAALELSSAVAHILSRKMQIVGTGLDRDLLSGSFRRAQRGDGVRRRMMDDVNPAAGLATQANHQLDGLVLSRARP